MARRSSTGDNVMLGMIVDRSSFDEEDELTHSLSDTDASFSMATRKGKVRRKLRWKPPGFRRSHKTTVSSNASVLTERSTRTAQSIHTFHSTATPVLSNKKSEKKRPVKRPNYPSTFDGVSTIDNEGGFVHSKMVTVPQEKSLPRSQTLPAALAHGSDGSESANLDPLGVQSNGVSPSKPPRRRRKERRKQGQKVEAPNLGTPPVCTKRELLVEDSPPPAVVDSSTSDISLSLETTLPNLSICELETDRRIGFFTESEEGGSPARKELPSSYILTLTPTRPQFTPERKRGRPPLTKRSNISTPPRHPSKPLSSSNAVPAKVDIDLDGSSTLHAMVSNSGYFIRQEQKGGRREEQSPTSMSAGHKAYHRPVDTILDASPAREDDGRQLRESSPRTRSKARTGPVDLDDGTFLEAERHLKAIHDMASEHMAHGEYAEALEVFEEILRGQRERHGSEHYRVGTALHNIGIVHLKAGHYEDAVAACQEAVHVRMGALPPNHPDVAVSLAQLGVALLECNQHREALIAFRQALKIRRECLGPKHPKVGKILNNIGCSLYDLQELQGAKLAFEEALEIQRETLRSSLEKQDSSTPSNQALLSIASTLCNIGSIRLRAGELEEASIALEEALLIQQSVLGDDHPTVLSTIENIDYVDKAREESIPIPFGQMIKSLSPWGAENSFPRLSPEESMSSSLTHALHRPKQWMEQALVADRACGTVNDVDDGEHSSVADSSIRDLERDNRVEV